MPYKDKEKRKENKQKYSKTSKYKRYQMEYYIKNKEKIVKRTKKYAEEHRNEKREKNKIYRDNNKKKFQIKHKLYYQANKEKFQTRYLRSYRKRKYGIDEVQFNKLLSEQGGVCLICQKGETNHDFRTGELIKMSIDHDHVTGKNRGLLCGKCNRAIGLFEDNPILLRKAAEYLENY